MVRAVAHCVSGVVAKAALLVLLARATRAGIIAAYFGGSADKGCDRGGVMMPMMMVAVVVFMAATTGVVVVMLVRRRGGF